MSGAIGYTLATAIEHAGYLVMAMQLLAVGWRRLLSHLWRSPAASAAMAGALWAVGLGWNSVADAHAATRDLLLAVPLGRWPMPSPCCCFGLPPAGRTAPSGM